MLKSYALIALRSLRRHTAYTLINILGLATGIACCVLILLYVQDERAFDSFHEKADRIYRVVEVQAAAEQTEQRTAMTAGPFGSVVAETFPEVTGAVRMLGASTIGRRTASFGDARFYESDYLFTEPSFFEVFDFEMLRGNKAAALQAPGSVVLTEAAALRYFGDRDPMGLILQIEQFGDFEVTGLLRNPPLHSHLDFSMLLSLATIQSMDRWGEWAESWDSNGFITYLVLESPGRRQALEAKLPAFLETYRTETSGVTRRPYLQPLTAIHFGSEAIGAERHAREGRTANLYIFSAIALFVLLIACINYMNLATARSMKRAREVGLRKVAGAHRGQLIGQFLSEAVLFALLSLLVAVAFVQLALPAFNALAEKALTLGGVSPLPLWLGLVVLAVGVGVVSGSYPAFYLSRYRPAHVLKGTVQPGKGAVRLRQVLVITQFALSTAMVVGTLVILQQLDYIDGKPLGFNEEDLLVVDINSGNTRANFETMKEAFGRVPAVQQVCTSSRVPGEWKNILEVEVVPEGVAVEQARSMSFFGIDPDFLATFELALADGRNFSDDLATDTAAVLINEAAARALGLTAAQGQRILIPAVVVNGQRSAVEMEVRVIGIVKDFHYRSLHERIEPLVLGSWSNPIQAIDYFTIRIRSDDLQATIGALRQVGEQFDPDHPFEYNFLDERLGDFYRAEVRTGRLFSLAAAFSILIAALGLFGLAAFTVEQRTREIGVRKVLGASVGQIILLLSRDFTHLVLAALFVAIPVAFLAMDAWLSEFAYHVALRPTVFVVAGALTFTIALLTVSFQAARAALADPVKALRYE